MGKKVVLEHMDSYEDWEKWDIPGELRQKMHLLARELRQRQTRSEVILWQAIRNRQLGGYKFRRQVPIGPFVVDFFCSEKHLIIEVDGEIHDSQQESDHLRQEVLESLGLRFLRCSAYEVETQLPVILNRILVTLSTLIANDDESRTL
jgi:very-short-patch-repair endonuclease